MIPNPQPIQQYATPYCSDKMPQQFYGQNIPSIDFYTYDTSSMTVATTAMPLQRAQTISDASEYDYDYYPTGYYPSPMTPGSCTPDELALSDSVSSSCFSETPSSFTDKSYFEPPQHPKIRQPSVTSQPSPALLHPPPSEVDALMKSIHPPPTTTLSPSPTSSTTSTPKLKRHLCPYTDCHKAFSQPTHLKIHLRSHTGEKPYTCSVSSCRQAFSQLGNLRTHERRHVGQRPNRKRSSSDPGARTKRYECILDGCRASTSPGGSGVSKHGKVFTQLGNLKAHMNKFHKDTLARLSAQFACTPASAEEMELRAYFAELYKNSNKGIKGRGKGRKVEVVLIEGEGVRL